MTVRNTAARLQVDQQRDNPIVARSDADKAFVQDLIDQVTAWLAEVCTIAL